ncbi:MAG: 23S rRNA (uracil(1939)-C(5))-methyltransferase RlmD [Lachnospiraceae bacterium]|nr:23S rRNA (uracil(1939)-C(5))-methyltransferase RlmD [Lachnospiraceae bacterium]
MALKKNDEIELKITDIGVNGEGIGKHDGQAVFVQGALPGDTIRAGITKVKKSYMYARVIKIISPSPDRIEPACSLSKKCGGCALQDMSYSAELRMKENKVRSDLIRIGGFPAEEVDRILKPIVGMEGDAVERYRNKAQFPVGTDREGHVVTGFFANHSHRIVPVKDCTMCMEENVVITGAIRDFMAMHRISAYDEETGKGLIRHILIRKGFSTGDLMVCLVINGDSLPHEADLISALSAIEGMRSISININIKRNNVIMGDRTENIFGQPFITDFIGDVKYRISPRSFFQVNPAQTIRLYSKALEYASLSGNETVWDLYCGIGTISLFLAGHAAKVYGVEVIPEAIEDAKQNAFINGFDNTEFFVGKAEDMDYTGFKKPDVIVVDPPRKGCDTLCLNAILSAEPDRIVYISCDPATLSRDLKILTAGGYRLLEATPFDQFPRSVHCECACLLTR